MHLPGEGTINTQSVAETLDALVAYEAVLTVEGVPFLEQREPGEGDLVRIESELIRYAGASRDDIVAWFHWQGGVPVAPGRGRAVVYGGFRPVGLRESLEASSRFRWYPVNHYPAPNGANPWVVLAVESPRQVLIVSVESGEVFTTTTDQEASHHVANSIVEMLGYWRELWSVVFEWVPGVGVNNKVALADVPKDLGAHSGYGFFG